MAAKHANSDATLPFVTIGEMESSAQTACLLGLASLTFATMTVGLRFFIRVSRKHSLDAGDFWLVVGLCLFGLESFVMIRGLETSGGTLNMKQFTPAGIFNFYKYLYAIGTLFPFVITTIKISVLLLYITAFPTRKFRHAAYTVICVCIVWLITFTLLLLFHCRPIRASWDLSFVLFGKATCMPFGKMLVAMETSNMAIDLVILSLPLSIIRSLQISRTRKFTCVCLFSLGSLILIACIMRIYYLANTTNSETGAAVPIAQGLNWSTAEVTIAITCASVPTYGPYFNKIGQMCSGLKLRIQSSALWSRMSTKQKFSGCSSSVVGAAKKEDDNDDDRKSSVKPHSLYLPHFPQAKDAEHQSNPSVDTDLSMTQVSRHTIDTNETYLNRRHDSPV